MEGLLLKLGRKTLRKKWKPAYFSIDDRLGTLTYFKVNGKGERTEKSKIQLSQVLVEAIEGELLGQNYCWEFRTDDNTHKFICCSTDVAERERWFGAMVKNKAKLTRDGKKVIDERRPPSRSVSHNAVPNPSHQHTFNPSGKDTSNLSTNMVIAANLKEDFCSPESVFEDIYAKYVPFTVRNRFSLNPEILEDAEMENFMGAVAFVDISGFTKLSEKLVKEHGSNGTELLNKYISGYFEKLINVIVEYGGDIIKFAGDAMLVIWRNTLTCAPEQKISLERLLLRCVECNLKLLALLDYFTPDGVDKNDTCLRLHTGIGVGLLKGIYVGGKGSWEFFIAGEPIQQMSDAGEEAESGQVVISAAAHAMIQGWCKVKPTPLKNFIIHSLTTDVPIPKLVIPSITKEMEPAMDGFIQVVVKKHVSSGQSARWLSEFRKVSIMFIKLPGIDYENDPDVLKTLQKCVRIVQTAVQAQDGTIARLLADDKGTRFKIAFGMPGLTHEDDCVRAVKAGLAIAKKIRMITQAPAIGIATGTVFCGNAGSQVRCEYTAVGFKVIMAARLMQAAGIGGILTDQETYESAKAAITFEPRPPIALKGVAELVAVFYPHSANASSRKKMAAMLGVDLKSHKPPTEIISGQQGKNSKSAQLHDDNQDSVVPSKPVLRFLQAEKKKLLDVLKKVEMDKQTRVVIVKGEVGLGKSTLVQDFTRQMQERNVLYAVGQARLREDEKMYPAWQAIFEQVLNITDLEENKKSRIRGMTDVKRRELVKRLEQSLSVGFSAADSSEALQEKATLLRHLKMWRSENVEDSSSESGSSHLSLPNTRKGDLKRDSWFRSVVSPLVSSSSVDFPEVRLGFPAEHLIVGLQPNNYPPLHGVLCVGCNYEHMSKTLVVTIYHAIGLKPNVDISVNVVMLPIDQRHPSQNTRKVKSSTGCPSWNEAFAYQLTAKEMICRLLELTIRTSTMGGLQTETIGKVLFPMDDVRTDPHKQNKQKATQAQGTWYAISMDQNNPANSSNLNRRESSETLKLALAQRQIALTKEKFKEIAASSLSNSTASTSSLSVDVVGDASPTHKKNNHSRQPSTPIQPSPSIKAKGDSHGQSFSQRENSNSNYKVSPEFGPCGVVQVGVWYDIATRMLNVRICEGKGLTGKCPNPYARIALYPPGEGSEELLTVTCQSTNAPIWDEAFSFLVLTSESLALKTLEVSLWHRHVEGNSDFLGKVCLDMADIPTSGLVRKWWLLSSDKPGDKNISDLCSFDDDITPTWSESSTVAQTSVGGKKLTESRRRSMFSNAANVSSVDGNAVELPSAKDVIGKLDIMVGALNATLSYDYVKGKLHLHVVRAAGLPLIGSTVCPYVKIYILPDLQQNTKCKTKVVIGAQNPEWNESFEWDLHLNELETKVIEMGVWNYQSSGNTLIGVVTGPLSEFLAMCEGHGSDALGTVVSPRWWALKLDKSTRDSGHYRSRGSQLLPQNVNKGELKLVIDKMDKKRQSRVPSDVLLPKQLSNGHGGDGVEEDDEDVDDEGDYFTDANLNTAKQPKSPAMFSRREFKRHVSIDLTGESLIGEVKRRQSFAERRMSAELGESFQKLAPAERKKSIFSMPPASNLVFVDLTDSTGAKRKISLNANLLSINLPEERGSIDGSKRSSTFNLPSRHVSVDLTSDSAFLMWQNKSNNKHKRNPSTMSEISEDDIETYEYEACDDNELTSDLDLMSPRTISALSPGVHHKLERKRQRSIRKLNDVIEVLKIVDLSLHAIQDEEETDELANTEEDPTLAPGFAFDDTTEDESSNAGLAEQEVERQEASVGRLLSIDEQREENIPVGEQSGLQSFLAGSEESEKNAPTRVLVLENLQWLDPRSWKFLLDVIRTCSSMMIVLTTRLMIKPYPADYQTIIDMPNFSDIELDVFSDQEVIQLCCEKLELGLGGLILEQIPANLRNLVVSTTYGHPLYAEELVKALLQNKMVHLENGKLTLVAQPSQLKDIEIRISRNIRNVLMGRVDNLNANTQLTLKLCSAMGGGTEVDVDMLTALHPAKISKEEVMVTVKELVNQEILLPDILDTYGYKHRYFKECVYSMLSMEQRDEILRDINHYNKKAKEAAFACNNSVKGH